ncbi:MAG: sulfatase-like hydrolase/transferase [Acidobacteria bacterium]|nr:sulfatase-like hydrolase/transferase [Acidobacteriota bacterium]
MTPKKSGKLAAVLLALGVTAVVVADSAWKTVSQHRSPYHSSANLPGGEPLTRRAVLIVLDGVRVDAARDMRSLQELERRGFGGTLTTILPSLSRPARATLVTGARPEVHGVMTNGAHQPPPIPSLFSAARATGVHTAVAGDSSWARAFPDQIDAVQEFDKELHASPTRDAGPILEWQKQVCDAMVPFLQQQSSGLLVAGVTAPDAAGHDFGGRSELYAEVVQAADACVSRIIGALDDGETTFLITSDHGHIDHRGQGGHGGTEPEVTTVPFVLAGKGVHSGGQPLDAVQASQLDVAPTLAALLGLPLPALAEGRPLELLLDLTDQQNAELRARSDQQQALMRQLLPDPGSTAASERIGRLTVSSTIAMALLGMAGLALFRIDAPWMRRLLAVLTFLLVYAALFWALGLQYSLSAVVREEYLNSFFLRNAAAAAVAFVAAALWTPRSPLWLGLLLQGLLGLRVARTYYRFGLFLETYLPNLDASFRSYLDLLAMAAIGAAACLFALTLRLRAGRTRVS